MRAAKVQASLRIRAVSPEPSLLAHTSSESRGTFRQKARSLAPLNGWACAVKICHDGMLEDTNSLDGARLLLQHQKQQCAKGNNYCLLSHLALQQKETTPRVKEHCTIKLVTILRCTLCLVLSISFIGCGHWCTKSNILGV